MLVAMVTMLEIVVRDRSFLMSQGGVVVLEGGGGGGGTILKQVPF